jgi:hypothetical protein
MVFEAGQRVRISGKDLPDWVTVDFAHLGDQGWKLYVKDDDGTVFPVDLSEAEALQAIVLSRDGRGNSAGAWSRPST